VVLQAENGLEAWTILSQTAPPRLAILDWIMPGMEGVDICQQLRKQQTDCPAYLILLTSRENKSSVVEGLNAGADDYLTKPYDPIELIARVEVGCRMIALQDRLAENIRELQDALTQIKTLRGIVPICSYCKKVRDDQGYWRQVEAYVSAHSEAKFSHSYCPQCMSIALAEEVDDL
jgi:phosphoserine phosphatase RsbU/P